MWKKIVFPRSSLSFYGGSLTIKSFTAKTNSQRVAIYRPFFKYFFFNLNKKHIPFYDHNIFCKAAWSYPRMYSSRNNKYTSNSTSFFRRRKEAVVLVLLGVTGGVVYGLNKKYENDKFDKEVDKINQIIKQAQSLGTDEKQMQMAVNLYTKAMKKVQIEIESEVHYQQRMNLLTTKFVFIVDQLANLMHGLGKLDEAENYYKQTLQAMISHGTGKDDDAVIEISLKLATIYAQEGRHERAENGFTWCVENSRRKAGEQVDVNSSALLGICLESYGKYMLSRKRANEAIKLLSEALAISRNIFEERHPQVVLLVNNLGVAYNEAGDVEVSKRLFKEAINLSKDKNDDNLGSFHLNLGNLFVQTGDLEEAKHEFNQALQLCNTERVKESIRNQLLTLP